MSNTLIYPVFSFNKRDETNNQSFLVNCFEQSLIAQYEEKEMGGPFKDYNVFVEFLYKDDYLNNPFQGIQSYIFLSFEHKKYPNFIDDFEKNPIDLIKNEMEQTYPKSVNDFYEIFKALNIYYMFKYNISKVKFKLFEDTGKLAVIDQSTDRILESFYYNNHFIDTYWIRDAISINEGHFKFFPISNINVDHINLSVHNKLKLIEIAEIIINNKVLEKFGLYLECVPSKY